MKSKIIIVIVALIIVIVVAISCFLIRNNTKYDENIIGVFYAKTPDTTYILKIDKNHLATLTYNEFEESKEKKLTWNNNYLIDDGVQTEYTFDDNKLLVNFNRGTLEFSKDENVKRVQKFYQVIFNSDVDDLKINTFEKNIEQYLIVSNVNHVSKEETKNTLLKNFKEYTNAITEELLSSARLSSSFTMMAYGTDTELNILENLLKSNDIVKNIHQTKI